VCNILAMMHSNLSMSRQDDDDGCRVPSAALPPSNASICDSLPVWFEHHIPHTLFTNASPSMKLIRRGEVDGDGDCDSHNC